MWKPRASAASRSVALSDEPSPAESGAGRASFTP
jgi:hypothetical protein